MSNEARKLWARTETVAAIKEAGRALRKARDAYTMLPQKERERVEVQIDHLERLADAILEWPVNKDERMALESRRAAKKAVLKSRA